MSDSPLCRYFSAGTGCGIQAPTGRKQNAPSATESQVALKSVQEQRRYHLPDNAKPYLDTPEGRIAWIESVYPGPKSAEFLQRIHELSLHAETKARTGPTLRELEILDRILVEFIADGDVELALTALIPIAANCSYGAINPRNKKIWAFLSNEQKANFSDAHRVCKITVDLMETMPEKIAVPYFERLCKASMGDVFKDDEFVRREQKRRSNAGNNRKDINVDGMSRD